MTTLTLTAVSPAVHIVSPVAGYALALDRSVVVVAVATSALGIRVLSKKRKRSRGMIEQRRIPIAGHMARVARSAELPAMHIVRLMAIDAHRICIPETRARRMAGAALDISMRSVQRKVGLPMIQRPDVGVDSVQLSTLMLCVA